MRRINRDRSKSARLHFFCFRINRDSSRVIENPPANFNRAFPWFFAALAGKSLFSVEARRGGPRLRTAADRTLGADCSASCGML